MQGNGPIPAYGRWLTARPWRVLLVAVSAALAAAWGVQYLSFSADYRVYFGADNPDLQAFQRFESAYTTSDNLVIAVRPRDGELFTPRMLGLLHELTEAAWQIPYATRVDSPSNFQHISAQGDDVVVADLVPDPAALTQAQAERIKARALAEPALVGRLLSEDASTAGVFVTLKFSGEDHTDHLPQAVEAAYALAERYRAEYPQARIAVSGVAAFSYTEVALSKADLATLTPIMLALMALCMLVLLRSLTAALVTLAMIGLSAATALGVAGWLGMQINASSAMAPTIILTLAVADSVHILVSVFDEMHAGRSKRDALVESLRLNAQPVFLTTLTTVIGFVSLNFSDTPPFRELGNITAIGISAAWVYAMTLLPAMIVLLPLHPRTRVGAGRGMMTRFGQFVVRRARLAFTASLVLSLVLLALIPRLEIDDQFLAWFDADLPFRQATDFITDNLTGPYTLEYSVPAAGENGISDPEYLRHLSRFAAWLQTQPDVVHVDQFGQVMKRLNRAMHGDQPDWYRLPRDPALAAQYLLLYELSLPAGRDLTSQINFDKSASRVTVTLDRVSSNRIETLAHRSEQWLRDNLPTYMHTQATGTMMLFTHLTARNIRAMLVGTALAFLLIAATLVIALRSLRLGLISLIPNFLPALLALGLWALLVGEIGLIVSVIAATTMGLIVDDTVHILSKYRRARREHDLAPADAIVYMFAHTGNALLITTVVLVLGFMVLYLSDFRLNSNMGLLTSIALAFALILDFFLLPPILMALGKRGDRTTPARAGDKPRAQTDPASGAAALHRNPRSPP
ncbi:RND efflux transporter [Salinisphaera sp. PC39]